MPSLPLVLTTTVLPVTAVPKMPATKVFFRAACGVGICVASRLAIQRICSVRRLIETGGVAVERSVPGRGVKPGTDVVIECVRTGRCVPDGVETVASERTRTHGGIVTTICIVL